METLILSHLVLTDRHHMQTTEDTLQYPKILVFSPLGLSHINHTRCMHVSPLQSGDPFLECTTRKVSKGEVSTFMHDKMEVGTKVLLGVPAGLFTAKVMISDLLILWIKLKVERDLKHSLFKTVSS